MINHFMLLKDLPLRDRFGLQFSLFARQWRRVIYTRLEASGLTDATWSPLVHLAAHGDGVTQKELAALVGIDGSTLVRLLDILAGKDLIERRTDETDRRAKKIYLTEKGRTAVRDIRIELNRTESEFLAGISDQELALVLDVLARIAPHLDQAERAL